MTALQQAQEAKREKQFNAVAEAIIETQPWGKFYSLMLAASKAGEGILPHRVCVDPQGRPIKVYKKGPIRWMASFIQPAHQHAAEGFAQKKWGRVVLGLAGFGWIGKLKDQAQAQCLEITPNDFLYEAARRKQMIADDPVRGRIQANQTARFSPQERAQNKKVMGQFMGTVSPSGSVGKSNIGTQISEQLKKIKPWQYAATALIVGLIIFIAYQLKTK